MPPLPPSGLPTNPSPAIPASCPHPPTPEEEESSRRSTEEMKPRLVARGTCTWMEWVGGDGRVSV